ncbi:RHS repeat-associated core domain-containing protein [Streptomyces chrestomyceticus]|uniref:RHS repeat-associated core domain-containing protein n=1 Tax=Streptomyces chrestomyceticus TaxID=68185 RepID=UPI0039DFF77E
MVGLADETSAKVNSYGYSPRGVARAANTEQVPQPYRFAGGYQGPTGLYHLGARYYDPSVGRFTQPDPSGQEKNPYLYAEGDPVKRIDPGGLSFLGEITGAVASTIASTLFDGVVGPVAGGAAGGCLGGVITAAIDGESKTEACLKQGAIGAATGGAGAAVKAGKAAYTASRRR